MSEQSKKLAGILLIILPTVAFGGTSLLSLLINDASGYATKRYDKTCGELAMYMPGCY